MSCTHGSAVEPTGPSKRLVERLFMIVPLQFNDDPELCSPLQRLHANRYISYGEVLVRTTFLLLKLALNIGTGGGHYQETKRVYKNPEVSLKLYSRSLFLSSVMLYAYWTRIKLVAPFWLRVPVMTTTASPACAMPSFFKSEIIDSIAESI